MAKSLKNMMGAGIGAGTATLINGTVADGLTATGSGQADALILTNDVNVIGTVPLGTGVRLLANPQPGDETLVTNLGANTLAIYPPLGATISGGPTNLPFSLPTGNTAEFIARNGSANWVALSSGGTAPTPPSASPLALGANLSIPNWYTYTPAFMDTAYSAPGSTSNEFGGFIGSTTGNPIPDANRDANGFPKSLPGGEAGIAFVCQLPTTLAQRKLTWVSKLGGANKGVATISMTQGGTGVSIDVPGQSVTYTPTNVADGASGSSEPAFIFTPVSGTDYPINFIDRPVTDSGAVLTPEFTSLIPAACSANPVIRFMDWGTCNRNNSPIHQTATAGKTVSSITFVGTLATVTTSTAHGLLGNGTASASASVTVSGVTPATYNVTDAYVKVISPTQFQYTMGGTPAGNASVVGSYTVGDAGFQFTNLHYPSVGSEPGTQFNEPIYTAANRNKNKADAEWHDGVQLESIVSLCTALGASPYYPVAPNSDSTFLADVATVLATFAASTGKPVYQSLGNEPWNSQFTHYHQLRNEANLRGTLGDALTACRLIAISNISLTGAQSIDGVAVVTSDRILVTGQTTASQNGVYVANTAGAWSRAADTIIFRSIWLVTSGLTYANTSWFVSTQGAITLGTTALAIAQVATQHRYAETLITAANAFISAFASAGVPSKLNIVAEWQNYAGTGVWDDMAAFVGPTDWAKVTHISVAPYYGDNSQMGIAATFTGPDATLKAAISTDIDASLTHLVSHVTKAVALGKKLITYEGGATTNLHDLTYKTAWAHGTNSTSAYDLELRFLQQTELRAAALQTGGLIHCQYNLTFPLAGSDFWWGLVEGLTQTRGATTTPKLKAHTDFLAGTRVLVDQTGSFQIPVGAVNGTAVGTAVQSALGSTFSLSNSSGGLFAINSTTGAVTVANAGLYTPGNSYPLAIDETLVTTHTTTLSVTALSGTLFNAATSSADFTLSNGNLTATRTTSGGNQLARATVTRTSGYFEMHIDAVGSSAQVGVDDGTQATNGWMGGGANSIGYNSAGNVFDASGSSVAGTWASFTTGDVIGVCIKGGNAYFSKNGTWQNSADPSAGTGGVPISGFLTNCIPGVSSGGLSAFTARFTSGFSGTIPTGVTSWS